MVGTGQARPEEWQRWALSIMSRAALMAAAWWVLTGGDTKYWWLSVALVGAAIGSTYLVVGAGYRRWHPLAIARFSTFFAYQSLLGGLDVARRAFDPRLPIHPGTVDYRLHIDDELTRVVIADTASLLPGTVGVELDGRKLTIHVLDTNLPVAETMERLERRVVDVLGEARGP